MLLHTPKAEASTLHPAVSHGDDSGLEGRTEESSSCIKYQGLRCLQVDGETLKCRAFVRRNNEQIPSVMNLLPHVNIRKAVRFVKNFI